MMIPRSFVGRRPVTDRWTDGPDRMDACFGRSMGFGRGRLALYLALQYRTYVDSRPPDRNHAVESVPA